jgi:hypothetical protein
MLVVALRFDTVRMAKRLGHSDGRPRSASTRTCASKCATPDELGASLEARHVHLLGGNNVSTGGRGQAQQEQTRATETRRSAAR